MTPSMPALETTAWSGLWNQQAKAQTDPNSSKPVRALLAEAR